jgi:hypothetical protein
VLVYEYPKASKKARGLEENGEIETDISTVCIAFASNVFFLCHFYLFLLSIAFYACRQYPRAQVPLIIVCINSACLAL